MTDLKVGASFGEITIPIEKIEAVKMRADGENSAVVALINGDMITGTIEVDELHLKTSWGKAHINAASVEEFQRVSSVVSTQIPAVADGVIRGAATINDSKMGVNRNFSPTGFPN